MYKAMKSNNILIKWLRENLLYSRGLIGKKCKRDWFIKYNQIHEWDLIHLHTKFLDEFNPSFPQRIWHLINDMSFIKCANPDCNNPPTFFSFNRGYLLSCSNTCAQYNPSTIEKIKTTNLKKYGVEYGLQNKEVRDKKLKTTLKRYGVSNVSNVKSVQDKKKETCLKNYGEEWYLARQDLKEESVRDKYGVANVQQVSKIANKRIKTRRSVFYDTLFKTNRLKDKCFPLFSKKQYISGGIDIKYLFECNTCNSEFLGWIHDGDIPRCSVCYPTKVSMFEKTILEYIKSLLPNDMIVLENDRKILLNNKELDIYVPDLKVAFECDGLYWHGEDAGNKDKKYHLNKTEECESKGIRLIHIFEDEYEKTPAIVRSKIKHILGFNVTEKIYARKCKIEELSSTSSKKFFKENHVQGSRNSKISLGLIYNNQIVSAMSFCLGRIFMNTKGKDDEYELLRYATLDGTNVIGGGGKLLSYFVKTYKPKKIISYADRRWTHSTDNIYEKIGFKKVTNGVPNYWYFGRGNDYKRHHRFGFAKHTLKRRLPSFDIKLTEWENMKLNGWDRIWDCGNLKYEMHFE